MVFATLCQTGEKCQGPALVRKSKDSIKMKRHCQTGNKPPRETAREDENPFNVVLVDLANV